MPRRATIHNKRDGNEMPILQAFATMGVQWFEAPPLDGWIFLFRFIPVEIKTKTGKLTPSQIGFIDRCKYLGMPYLVLRSVDDAIAAVNALRKCGQ